MTTFTRDDALAAVDALIAEGLPKNVIIPGGYTSIGAEAFENLVILSVIIPEALHLLIMMHFTATSY